MKEAFFDYSELYEQLQHSTMQGWLEQLPKQIEDAFFHSNNGNFSGWHEALKNLPEVSATSVDFSADTIRVGELNDCDLETRQVIESHLKALHPWRKGPYSIHNTFIDTEWRSDWKWQRLLPHLKPLSGRCVLDIGCGNGYHVWKMLGAGAQWVLGVDPYLLFVMQYQAIRHFAGKHPAYVIPLGIEQLPFDQLSFDTVFSMGVLYHRRSPMDHLIELRETLKTGGELVLETLVVDGGEGQVLVPQNRYAKMRNVWFIPSCLTLEKWLQRCGFKDVRLVDVNQTTTEEQRATDWMTFESLADFLNPDNVNQTIEGYPAPKRAIFIAT